MEEDPFFFNKTITERGKAKLSGDDQKPLALLGKENFWMKCVICSKHRFLFSLPKGSFSYIVVYVGIYKYWSVSLKVEERNQSRFKEIFKVYMYDIGLFIDCLIKEK